MSLRLDAHLGLGDIKRTSVTVTQNARGRPCRTSHESLPVKWRTMNVWLKRHCAATDVRGNMARMACEGQGVMMGAGAAMAPRSPMPRRPSHARAAVSQNTPRRKSHRGTSDAGDSSASASNAPCVFVGKRVSCDIASYKVTRQRRACVG